MPELNLHLGVKTDPIETRFSYEWLFRILSEEGVRHVQIGTFFELYQLPDAFFLDLRKKADDFGIAISSLFTAHRELGGFFRDEPGFVEVARKNYERYIEVASLLGASSVGSNPGAVLRDRMGTKGAGLETYLAHMKELSALAKDAGIERLTVEPMSCLAEPPTLPDEIRTMAETLGADVGYCVDVAHGYVDREGNTVHDHWELMEAALSHTTELHLKNTDAMYNSTFGFSAEERERGIIEASRVRDFYLGRADRLPDTDLVGYLEIGGPKTGRDYSDALLEGELRESLGHLKETFLGDATAEAVIPAPVRIDTDTKAKKIAPSMMCCDLLHFEESVRRLERNGADILHLDIMDSAFAPNMPLGLEILKQLRPKTDLPFDVHLMVENNQLFIDLFGELGAQMVSVHAESSLHLDRTLASIRDYGMKAGVALNPATPLSALDYVHDKLDFVLLMTVNPGFAGQKVIESTIGKIADCRAYLDRHDLDIPIEVDGNVSFENIPRMVAAGGDILVAGTSSVFHKEGSMADNFSWTREAIEAGLRMNEAVPVR